MIVIALVLYLVCFIGTLAYVKRYFNLDNASRNILASAWPLSIVPLFMAQIIAELDL